MDLNVRRISFGYNSYEVLILMLYIAHNFSNCNRNYITKNLMMVDGIMRLLRLPLKFILRFKCVSKTFYTLIQSTSFNNLHLNHTTISTYDKILQKRSFKENIQWYKAIFSFISSEGNDNLKFVLSGSRCSLYDKYY